MKRLIFLILTLALAVAIGLSMHADAGYVLIAYKNWTVETTLWIFLAAVFLTFLILYFIAALLRGVSTFSRFVNRWFQQHTTEKARQQTGEGMRDWAEGKWYSAEKKLVKSASKSDLPLINWLVAAEAAQHQGAEDKRDNYLRRAHAADPNAEIAVGLTQAQLQISAKQFELALATLQHLQEITPRHTFVMQLLPKVYVELKEWKSLRELLPSLRKYKVLTNAELQQLEKNVYINLLQELTNTDNVDDVQQLWEQLPRYLQQDADLLAIYTRVLIEHHHGEVAEKLLRTAIKKNWNSELVEIYGKIFDADRLKQLHFAETWLRDHPDEVTLLLCLGRLCKRQGLWGKAQGYLQRCLTLQPSKVAYQELAQIMEQLGNQNAALEYYRKANN